MTAGRHESIWSKSDNRLLESRSQEMDEYIIQIAERRLEFSQTQDE